MTPPGETNPLRLPPLSELLRKLHEGIAAGELTRAPGVKIQQYVPNITHVADADGKLAAGSWSEMETNYYILPLGVKINDDRARTLNRRLSELFTTAANKQGAARSIFMLSNSALLGLNSQDFIPKFIEGKLIDYLGVRSNSDNERMLGVLRALEEEAREQEQKDKVKGPFNILRNTTVSKLTEALYEAVYDGRHQLFCRHVDARNYHRRLELQVSDGYQDLPMPVDAHYAAIPITGDWRRLRDQLPDLNAHFRKERKPRFSGWDVAATHLATQARLCSGFEFFQMNNQMYFGLRIPQRLTELPKELEHVVGHYELHAHNYTPVPVRAA